jgi:hypothetical protein
MSDTFSQNANPTPRTPTAEDYAAFLAWQAANQPAATPSELADEDYEFKVGEVVRTATGYGIVVSRGPVAAGNSGRQDGYVIAQFATANDLPANAHDLGLSGL